MKASRRWLSALFAAALCSGCGGKAIPPPPTPEEIETARRQAMLAGVVAALTRFAAADPPDVAMLERIKREYGEEFDHESAVADKATEVVEGARASWRAKGEVACRHCIDVADRAVKDGEWDDAISALSAFPSAYAGTEWATRIQEKARSVRARRDGESLAEAVLRRADDFVADKEFDRGVGVLKGYQVFENLKGTDGWKQVEDKLAEVQRARDSFYASFGGKPPIWEPMIRGEDLGNFDFASGAEDVWRLDDDVMVGNNDKGLGPDKAFVAIGGKEWADYFIKFEFKLKGAKAVVTFRTRDVGGKQQWDYIYLRDTDYQDEDVWNEMVIRVVGQEVRWSCEKARVRDSKGLKQVSGPIGFGIDKDGRFEIRGLRVKVLRKVQVAEEEAAPSESASEEEEEEEEGAGDGGEEEGD